MNRPNIETYWILKTHSKVEYELEHWITDNIDDLILYIQELEDRLDSIQGIVND